MNHETCSEKCDSYRNRTLTKKEELAIGLAALK